MIKYRPLQGYIYLLIVILVLFYNAISSLEWGYDEFAVINTHLELDDPDFINIYKAYLDDLGVKNPQVVNFIIDNVLPIVVVPLRWTYALGISPIVGLSRIIDAGWPLIGSLLLMPNIVLFAVGGYLIMKSLCVTRQSSDVFLIFIVLLLLSHPFLNWTLTLTSYSYHLFCFGLIIYAEVVQRYRNNNFLGGASLMRSAVQIFNYQYIVIVAIFGLLEFIKNPKLFFKQKRYISWIIPAVTAALSIVFLVFRAKASGQHSNPAFASIDKHEVEKFDLFSNAESLVSTIEFFVNRLVDFIYYFFFESAGYYNTVNYSNFSIYLILPVILAITVMYLKAFKKDSSSFKMVLLVFLLSLLFPYIIGIQPMTPSRHSLVLLLPFILTLSFIINYLLAYIPSSKVRKIGLLFLLCITAIQAVGFNQTKQKDLIISEVISTLEDYKIQHVALSRCDLKPTLYKDISKNRVIYYRCGSVIARKIPSQVSRVAILSEKKMSIKTAKEVISSYSDKQWQPLSLNMDDNACENEKCLVNIMILNTF